MRVRGRMVSRSVALLLSATAVGACANEPPPLGYYGADYDEFPTPGEPRTPLQIWRRLVEDGYETFSPPKQEGAVYFVGVYDRRRTPGCMILHAFSGAILEVFAYGRNGELIGLNRNTPGPGFPGAPPAPDGRFASFCPPPPTLANAKLTKGLTVRY